MFTISSTKAPSKARLEELLSFSQELGVTFNDISLLELSLTHTSYSNESGCPSNERLEFLGDSVLGLVCADYLYSTLPGHPEGDLSRIKSMVVSEESLAEVSHRFHLAERLHIGHGEELNGGRHKKAILADAMEAIIAAIYLDQGFECARKYVLSWLKNRGKVPTYFLDRVKGPEHNPTFYVKVFIGQKAFGPASGSNKKQAEQNAARLALISLNVISED